MHKRTGYALFAAAVAAAAAIVVWFARSAPEQPTTLVQQAPNLARFQAEVREFFARAPVMSPEARTARAKRIAQEITRYEAAGEVTAAEALTWREGLVRATVEDPVEQLVAIRGLQELYRGAL